MACAAINSVGECMAGQGGSAWRISCCVTLPQSLPSPPLPPPPFTSLHFLWSFPVLFPLPPSQVGMAAMLASVCSVPLTSVLLLFELTKDYRILLPLMVGTRHQGEGEGTGEATPCHAPDAHYAVHVCRMALPAVSPAPHSLLQCLSLYAMRPSARCSVSLLHLSSECLFEWMLEIPPLPPCRQSLLARLLP